MSQKKQITIEQLNRDGMSRYAEITSVSESERTVELSFSSEEAEVQRWFGIEKLDHSPGAVRLDRINQGGALLVNHDRDDQVGVNEKAWISYEERKGRAVVRFGKSARAQEIFDDVKDKIRQNVSVNYFVHAMKLLETRSDGEDVYLMTDWEPAEISIVSVPADTGVGIGRSENTPVVPTEHGLPLSTQEERELPMKNEQNQEVRTTEPQAPTVTVQERTQPEESKAISQLGRQYGESEMALKFIEEGKTSAEFQRALLDKLNERGSKPLKDMDTPEIGLSEREAGKFSFVKAIRALANPGDIALRDAAGFEFECSRAAAKKLGRDAQGILVPYEVLSRAITTSTAGNVAGATGGHLVGTTHMAGSFIDVLRNRTVVMRMAMVLSGLVGNIEVPKQTSGGQGYWVGEDGDATESGAEFGQIAMGPKTVGAYTEITRKLLQQSTPDIETLVRMDLAKSLAITIDKAAFYGTGDNNQPLGIIATDGINVSEFTAANPTFAEIVEMESKIAADNADVNSMAYVMNALMRGHLKTTQKFPGETVNNGGSIWEQGNTVNGYGTEVTNQITTGDIVFGNFADLIIGMWGALDLTADPYSNSKKGRLRIVAFQDVDYALRHPESFCLGREAED
ncbi:MAG: phage major capsid protein [Candidatus Margulisiibacteriota bacterium]